MLDAVSKNGSELHPLLLSANEPYSISFTTKMESMVHWKAYGDEQGVCICFSREHLLKLAFNDIGSLTRFFDVQKAMYTKDERYATFREQLDATIDFFKSYRELWTDDTCRYWGVEDYICYVLQTIFAHMRNFVKDLYWQDEREVRLIYEHNYALSSLKLIKRVTTKREPDIFKLYNTFFNGMGLKKLKFDCRSNIRPYRELNLNNKSNFSSALIPQIILGPRCEQDAKTLQIFLRSYGLMSTEVRYSDIQLR